MADDQLTQSRETREKEESNQASAVTMWTEAVRETPWGPNVIIANRSLDAVTVGVSGTGYSADGKTTTTHRLLLGEVPPCTRITITHGDLVFWTHAPNPIGIQVDRMVFQDSAGVTWLRSESGLLNRAGPGQPFTSFQDFIDRGLDNSPTYARVMMGTLLQKKLDACDSP